MNELKSAIGYVKVAQRSIGSDIALRLMMGGLQQDSDEFTALTIIYEKASHLRLLLQIVEDEDWQKIIASIETDPPTEL